MNRRFTAVCTIEVLVTFAHVATPVEPQHTPGAAHRVLAKMLAQNARWLAPTPQFDRLAYTFHTQREDVREACVVQRDGFAVFEVVGDGLGKMKDRLGQRRIVLADGRVAHAHRDDRLAAVNARSDTRHAPDEAATWRRYALTGCQLDLPLLELARVLDGAVVQIENGQWQGVPCTVATVRVPRRSACLGCGTMLAFTSWSYVHHLWPEYEVLYIDSERNVPVHETFVDAAGGKFEIDFGDYAPCGPPGDESLVPLQIEITSPEYFTCRYEFQIVGGRQWLLKTVESWFDPENTSRGVIENATVDEPAPLAESARRQAAAYQELFEPSTAPVRSTLPIATQPFVLGKSQRAGAADVLFTLGRHSDLLVRAAVPTDVSSAPDLASVLLLDAEDRLVGATTVVLTSATTSTGVAKAIGPGAFGRSPALADARRLVASLSPDDGAGSEQRTLSVIPVAANGAPAPATAVVDASGNTRAVDVALRRRADGAPAVAMRFVTRDRMNEFELDVSVGAFDAAGRLIAAAMASRRLHVEARIVEETCEIALPATAPLEDVAYVAIGLTRGATISAPMGSLWGTFLDSPAPFPIDMLLAAEAPECRLLGVERLEAQIEETLSHGLLDSPRDWRQQIERRQTPADALAPYAERLVRLIDDSSDPQTLAAALRLCGLAGDHRSAKRAVALLGDANPKVRSSAAICLVLLGRDEGLAQLTNLLETPADTGAEATAQRSAYRPQRLARVALATLRSEGSTEAVRRLLRAYVDGIETPATQNAGAGGTRYELEQLALLLAALPDQRYVPMLTDAIERLEARTDLRGQYDAGALLSALLVYGSEVHAFIDARVRRADRATLYALVHSEADQFYVPAMQAMLAASDDARAWHWAVRYLWSVGTPAAVDVLRVAYDRRVAKPQRDEALQLEMARALAACGDSRGLADAWRVLIDVERASSPPEDASMRRKWKKARDDRRDAALDVFDRASAESVIGWLTARTEGQKDAERLAALAVMGQMRSLPAELTASIDAWSKDQSSSAAEAALLLQMRNR